jgi:hypothetical protein
VAPGAENGLPICNASGDVKATLDGEEVTPTIASKTGYTLTASYDPAKTAAQAAEKTLYVSTDGNDGNDGSSWSQAFLTLAAAVSASSDGDTIKIGSGTFALSSALKWNTTLKIVGRGRQLTRITGNATNYLKPGAYSELHDLWCDQIAFKTSDTAWAHLKLYNVYCYGIADALFPSSLSTTCQLSAYNCEFSSNGDAIYLTATTGLTAQLYNCVVTGGNTGIIVSGGRVVMIGGIIRGYMASSATWKAAVILTAGSIDLVGVSVVDAHHTIKPTTHLAATGSGSLGVSMCAYDTDKTTGTINIPVASQKPLRFIITTLIYL